MAQNLVLGEYSWIVVAGSIAAFIFGFGTGSNDVANAFGTSVGAKTLTLKTAVLIAIIFEFTGALVLGRVSQETISGGIADIGAFTTDPEFFAYGMFWALLVGGVWQIVASYKELNVSATHSIIGAIVGFSMAYKGKGAVIWAQKQVVCTGPFTGLNKDGKPQTDFMRPFQPVATQYEVSTLAIPNLPGKSYSTYGNIPYPFQIANVSWPFKVGPYYYPPNLNNTNTVPWPGPSPNVGRWVYQRGKFSVSMDDVFDASTCALRTAATNVITTQWLTNKLSLFWNNQTGMMYDYNATNTTQIQVTDRAGNQFNLSSTPGTSTFDQQNFLINWPAPTNISGGLNKPYVCYFGKCSSLDYPYTSLAPHPDDDAFKQAFGNPQYWEFQLLTATPAGKAWTCNSGDIIVPLAKTPAIAYQWWLQPSGTNPGICNSASNANIPFPPYKGVLIIVLSWFFSPVLTGIASCIIFTLSRHLVLRSKNAYQRSFFVLPPLAFLTFWVNIFFVLTKGAAKTLSSQAEGWTPVKAAWIAAASAGGVSFFSAVVIAPLMYMRINSTFAQKEAAEASAKELELEDAKKGEEAPEAATVDVEVAEVAEVAKTAQQMRMDQLRGYMGQARDAAMHGMEVDVHAIVEEDELVAAIHANAEIFDEKAETVYAYMQVFSAICVIFAHGAGEVGYMSGPLGAIFSIVRSGQLSSNSSPPIWTVIIGALGLVIGLGTYGYSVTRAVGTRLAKLTPSRGFAAEVSTSMIIMIAAQYGLPTSSSQCITGGIIGIALCEGRAGLNFKFLFQTFMSWVWTLIFVAMITAFFFSQGAYAPSVQMSRQIGYYEEALSVRSALILSSYKSMIGASGYNTANQNDQFNKYLTTTISNLAPGSYYSYAKAPDGYYPGNKAPNVQTVAPWQMIGYLDTALALMQYSVVPATGVNGVAQGINMCASMPAANFSSKAAYFPWSQLAMANGSDPSSTYLNPCTTVITPTSHPKNMAKYPLTKANFVGPTPNTAFGPYYGGQYEDLNGNPISAFNGTVDRFFNFYYVGNVGVYNTTSAFTALPFPPGNPVNSSAGIPGRAAFGDVTLDQKLTSSTSGTCQQAPCNQLYRPQSFMG